MLSKLIKLLSLSSFLLISTSSFGDVIDVGNDKYFEKTRKQIDLYNFAQQNPSNFVNFPSDLRIYKECNLELGCGDVNGIRDIHNIKSFNKFTATITKVVNSNNVKNRYINTENIAINKERKRNYENDTPIIYGTVAGVSAGSLSRLDKSKTDVKTRNVGTAATVAGVVIGTVVGNSKSKNLNANLTSIPITHIFIDLDDGRIAKFIVDRDYEFINNMVTGAKLTFNKDEETNLWSFDFN